MRDSWVKVGDVLDAPKVEVLTERIAEYVQIAILALPDGGGKTANEARAIGEKVARLVILDEPSEPVELAPVRTYRLEDVPVVDGRLTLPNGTTVDAPPGVESVRIAILDERT